MLIGQSVLDLEPFTHWRFNIERQNSISNGRIQYYHFGTSLVLTSKIIKKKFEMYLLFFLIMKEQVINSFSNGSVILCHIKNYVIIFVWPDFWVIRSCETIARLVCHASLLKVDDVRLKRHNRSDRSCSLCDMYEYDNVEHLVMHCPRLQPERTSMFYEINEIEGRCGKVILSNSVSTLGVLLGRSVDNLPQELMDEVWLVAAKHIGKMYYRCLSLRKGIG